MSDKFDQKWSQLSKADQTAMRDKYDNKQGWQDAKARSEGYMNEQARRKNSGERHLKNNPDYVAPSTPPPKQTATSTNTAPSNAVEEAAKPAHNWNLSSNPDDSYEDIQGKYQAIYRNQSLFGGSPEGRNVFEEAGLRDPSFLYDISNNSRSAWEKKYGGDRESAYEAMGFVKKGGGWGRPDTMDRATFNLDPDGYAKENPELFGDRASGERGYNPNDDEFRATYDYSTEIPVMRNSTTDGIWAKNLEDSMGQSIEDMNKNINPNSGIDYSMGYSERSGGSDYGVYRRASLTEEQDPDSVRDKGNIDELHRSGNYGQGFYEKMANDPIQNLYDPHGHFTNYDFTPYKKGGSKYSGLYR